MIIELTFEKFYNTFNTMRHFIGAARLTKLLKSQLHLHLIL